MAAIVYICSGKIVNQYIEARMFETGHVRSVKPDGGVVVVPAGADPALFFVFAFCLGGRTIAQNSAQVLTNSFLTAYQSR